MQQNYLYYIIKTTCGRVIMVRQKTLHNVKAPLPSLPTSDRHKKRYGISAETINRRLSARRNPERA